MAHGTPDWWGSEPTSTVLQIQDVGELAARLGSPDTHHRGGNVIFIDGFENGLSPYEVVYFGAGSGVVVSADTSRNGGFSCKLDTGAVELAYAEVLRRQPYPSVSKHALELSFTLDDNASDVHLFIAVYDGTNCTTFGVRYLPGTDKWQYIDDGGDWQDLATSVVLVADSDLFHWAKLIIDLEAGEYVRLLYNSQEESMAGIAGYQFASDNSPWMDAGILLHGGVAAAATIYTDDLIITQNEPT